MTEHDPEHDPGQERVRALLADLGSSGGHPPGPVPDDVAARLDATLAGLSGPAHEQGHEHAPPDRRRWPQLLVAAAVAVVVGAGAVTATLATRGSSGSSSDSGAAGGAASSARSDQAESGPADDATVPTLTRAGFAAQVATLLADPAAEARRPGRATLAAGCASPPGRGEVLTVRFEGEPAVLVVRPAEGGRSAVEAWTCDASQVLARTRVAASGDQPPD